MLLIDTFIFNIESMIVKDCKAKMVQILLALIIEKKQIYKFMCCKIMQKDVDVDV